MGGNAYLQGGSSHADRYFLIEDETLEVAASSDAQSTEDGATTGATSRDSSPEGYDDEIAWEALRRIENLPTHVRPAVFAQVDLVISTAEKVVHRG